MRRTKNAMTTTNGLTPKQLKLLEELVKGTAVVEISRKTGIPRSTIYYDMKKPAFQEAYDAMKWVISQGNFQRAQKIASKAWETLEVLLDSKNETSRLKASEVTLKASAVQSPTKLPTAPLPKFDLKETGLTLEKIEEIQVKLMAQVVEGELDENSFWRAWTLFDYVRSKLDHIQSMKPWKNFGHFSHGNDE
jgi:hypothetical protein